VPGLVLCRIRIRDSGRICNRFRVRIVAMVSYGSLARARVRFWFSIYLM
jgi:hypothetical protein